MAITLNEVAAEDFVTRAGVLALVGVAVTVFVYGAVALIVKMDDLGLHLAEKPSQLARSVGRGLLKAMPVLLLVLSFVGTIAMLWVGGGIILHGMHELGLHTLSDWAHDAQVAVEGATGSLSGILGWATYAALSALVGLALGVVIALVLHKLLKIGNEAGAH